MMFDVWWKDNGWRTMETRESAWTVWEAALRRAASLVRELREDEMCAQAIEREADDGR